MSTTDVRAARDALEDAVGSTDNPEVRESLEEVASAFAEIEDEESEPDHAVFDSHLNTLRQARERAGGETAQAVGEALEHAEAYREDLSRT